MHCGASWRASSEPQLIEICGYFSASFGTSIDLFSTLSEPIVERFEASDRLDLKLQAAMAELLAQEVGMGAMITALAEASAAHPAAKIPEIERQLGGAVLPVR